MLRRRKEVARQHLQPVMCATEHAAILEEVKGIVAVGAAAQIAIGKKLEAHLIDEPLWQRGVDGKLDAVVGKLTAVMDIRVNGTVPLPGEFPLQTSLRGLHDVIHPVQVKREFWEKFREYRRTSWLFQALSSKVVRAILLFALFIALNSFAKHFGIPITLDALMKLFGGG